MPTLCSFVDYCVYLDLMICHKMGSAGIKIQKFYFIITQDSHLKMINDELMLDEALRRNEINQQCQQPLDEISPPEQFQTKSGEGGSGETQHSSPGRKPFSRSVSIGGGGGAKFKPDGNNRSSNEDSSPRKRNSSYETSAAAGDEMEVEQPGDFLSNPSPALQNLFGSSGTSASVWSGQHYAVSADILQRPVMSFVLQWNDLESLQIAMTMALRKSACRTFAMQVQNS